MMSTPCYKTDVGYAKAVGEILRFEIELIKIKNSK